MLIVFRFGNVLCGSLILLILFSHAAQAQHVKRIWPYANTTHTCAITPTLDEVFAGDSGYVLFLHLDSVGQNRRRGWFDYLNKSVALLASVVTDSNSAVVAGTRGQIWYTVNGGQHWNGTTVRTTATVHSLTSNGNKIVVCVGDSGLIERSTDDGHTWKRLTSPVSTQLNSVTFGTPSNGVAVGNDTTIVQTTDSGKTWSRMAFPYDLRPIANSIQRVDFSAVAMSGSDSVWVGLERPILPLLIIHGSADPAATLSPFPNSGPLTSLVYVGAKDLSLMAFAPDDYQYECRPGTGWFRQRVGWPEDADGTIDSAHLRTRCAAIRKQAGRFTIITGGDDFQQYQSWIVGSPANPDSIVNWLWFQTPGTDALIEWIEIDDHRRAVEYNDSIVFGVGAQGAIWVTMDKGFTWQNAYSPPLSYGRYTQGSLSSIWKVDSLKVLAAGWAGLILRSSDGGSNWDSVSSGTKNRLHEIVFPTRDEGIIVGDYGVILRTNDTGKSWEIIPTAIQDFLWAAAFATDSVGVAVGDNGRILRTVDAGLHWSDVNNVLSGTQYSIRQVQAFSDGTMYARANGALIRSVNFGKDWQFAPMPGGDSIGMNFYSSHIGIVVEGTSSSQREPDTAFVVYTSDASAHWKEVRVPLWNNHRVLSHWLNDHQVLLYGTAGFVELVDFSTGDVKITCEDAPGLRTALTVYPTPSNGEVRVEYTTTTNGPVIFELWDETGRLTLGLFRGNEIEGRHERTFNLPSELHGAYFVRLTADGTTATARLQIQ